MLNNKLLTSLGGRGKFTHTLTRTGDDVLEQNPRETEGFGVIGVWTMGNNAIVATFSEGGMHHSGMEVVRVDTGQVGRGKVLDYPTEGPVTITVFNIAFTDVPIGGSVRVRISPWEET